MLKPAEKFAKGPPYTRMNYVGADLRQRLEHESTFEHAGMRNLQMRKMDRLLAVEKEVDVDRPGPPSLFTHSSLFVLDSLNFFQQRLRRKSRREHRCGVQKISLRRPADGFGFEEGRKFPFADLRNLAKPLNGAEEVRFTIAEIRSKRYRHQGHESEETRTVLGKKRPRSQSTGPESMYP